MADAVLLSQDTYDRIMKMLEKWENGDIIQPGVDLINEETGTGYQKLGIDVNALLSDLGIPTGFTIDTIDLDVCVDGESETHTFLILD